MGGGGEAKSDRFGLTLFLLCDLGGKRKQLFPRGPEKEAILAGVTYAFLGQSLWPEEWEPVTDQTWVRWPRGGSCGWLEPDGVGRVAGGGGEFPRRLLLLLPRR